MILLNLPEAEEAVSQAHVREIILCFSTDILSPFYIVAKRLGDDKRFSKITEMPRDGLTWHVPFSTLSKVLDILDGLHGVPSATNIPLRVCLRLCPKFAKSPKE